MSLEEHRICVVAITCDACGETESQIILDTDPEGRIRPWDKPWKTVSFSGPFGGGKQRTDACSKACYMKLAEADYDKG